MDFACSLDNTASSGVSGSSMARSSLRKWPVSMMWQWSAGVSPAPKGRRDAGAPTRNLDTSSIGFCVADRPMRLSPPPVSRSRRSKDKARCEPRLLPKIAWISSTITVLTDCNSLRPPTLVSSRYADSGVVTRMCGGCLNIAARAGAGVSPLRTKQRIATSVWPDSNSLRPMPSSGWRRFFSISLPSAFKGEMYSTWVWSAKRRSAPSSTRSSMAERKAARVLPEPVGAAMSVCLPSVIASQARAWHSVGPGKVSWNQAATAGWKRFRIMLLSLGLASRYAA